MIYHIDLSHRQLQTRHMRDKLLWILGGLIFLIAAYGWVLFLVRNV